MPRRVHNLSGRSIQVQQDILDAAQAAGAFSNAADCFLNINDAIDTFLLRLEHLEDLIGISLEMHTERDELVVLRVINGETNGFLKSINLSRRSINLATGHCSTNAVVAMKAQQALTLFDEAVSLVGAIRDRALSGPPR
jgi:hypothetical protein